MYKQKGRATSSSNISYISFVEISHEIISMTILSLPLIQAGYSCQLHVLGKVCALSLVIAWRSSLPKNSVKWLTV